MSRLKIRQGSKIELAFADKKDDEFPMKSTFEKNLNDATFLVTIPIQDGELVEITEFDKLLMRYKIGSRAFVIEAYMEEIVTQGIRTCWKLRKVTEGREFFNRADIRVRTQLRMKATKMWWTPQGREQSEELDALTLDVSNSGAALYINAPFHVGEVTTLIFPSRGRMKGVHQNAEVCWVREVEKDRNIPFKRVMGVRYVFLDDEKAQERMVKYLSDIVPKQEEATV